MLNKNCRGEFIRPNVVADFQSADVDVEENGSRSDFIGARTWKWFLLFFISRGVQHFNRALKCRRNFLPGFSRGLFGFLLLPLISYLPAVFLAGLLSPICLYAASDIKAKLNSNDGTSTFAIQDSDESEVATISSDGYMVLDGSITIKGGGIILDSGTPYIKRGITTDQIRLAGATSSSDGACIELYGKDILNASSGTIKIIYGGSASEDIGIVEFLHYDGGWNTRFQLDPAGVLTISSNVYVGGTTDKYLGLANGDLALCGMYSGWMRFITDGGSFHWFVDGDANSTVEAMMLDVNSRLYMGDQTNRYMVDSNFATEFSSNVRVIGTIISSDSVKYVPRSAAPTAEEGALYYDSDDDQLLLYDASGSWVQIGTGPVVAGGGGADDLGNHIATQDLNMSNFNIVNISSVVIQSSATVQGAGGLKVDYGISGATAVFTGDVKATSFTMTNGGKFYPTNSTEQYFWCDGSVLSYIDTGTDDMRFSMGGSPGQFQWFADGATMSDVEMYLTGTGNLVIDGNFYPGEQSVGYIGYNYTYDAIQISTHTLIPGDSSIRSTGDVKVRVDMDGDGTEAFKVLDTNGIEKFRADEDGKVYPGAPSGISTDRYIWDSNYATEFSSNVRVIGTIISSDSVKYVPRSAAPTAEEGALYYDSDDDQLLLYDASGSWVQIGTGPVVAGGGGADDLGNHTATQNLDMANLSVIRISSATVTGTGGLEVTYGINAATLTTTGDITVLGNDIKDSGGSAAITFDGSQNITMASDVVVVGSVSVQGTNGLEVGTRITDEGTVSITRDNVDIYWESEANPRLRLNRDIGGGGYAGIAFGPGGATAVDTKIWRQGAGVLRMNVYQIERDVDNSLIKMVAGTDNSLDASVEFYGRNVSGNEGRFRIIIPPGASNKGFDIMAAGGSWPRLVVISTIGAMAIGDFDPNPAYKIELDGDTYADVNGWVDSSNRDKKENFISLTDVSRPPIKIGKWTGNGSTVDAIEYAEGPEVKLTNEELLKRVKMLPITHWNFIESKPKNQENPNGVIYHVGPTAQDFYKLFGLGERDTTIKATDMAGVAFAAIKAQQKEIEDLKTKLAQLVILITQK